MPASDSFVQSLERGLAVIRAFHAEAPALTLTDVSASTGLTRATARRFLLTLSKLGYVRTDGKLFWLTPRVLELGYSYLSGSSLSDVAQPHLDDLSHRVGESSSVSVLDGDEVVYVARVPARRIMAVRIAVGTRFAAHATSMGRVLLAGLPAEAFELYLARLSPVRYTDRTITDLATLRQTIEGARAQGWCATSVATKPMNHLRDQLIPELIATAQVISAELELVDPQHHVRVDHGETR
jgi:IclR family pca regulon transcriptional regulator